jgi:glycosyltransferase involved in cell wall biosynthesis
MKKSILVFRDYYLPGFKSGGPIQSVSNLVGHLGEEFDFKIVTLDRDEGDSEPYGSVKINDWNQVGKAQVFYMSSDDNSLPILRSLLNNTHYDLMYLNSFFSPQFTIVPLTLRKLKLVPQAPTIVAPRGELSPWALGLKPKKKWVFLKVSKLIELYSDVLWHATDNKEAGEIQRVIGDTADVEIAGVPLPHADSDGLPPDRIRKRPNTLKIGFLGRISRIKNVEFALEVLRELDEGDISFDLHGPIEDQQYYEQCQTLASRLPEHIQVEFHDSLAHPLVNETLCNYDLMFLPSKSESFGHAILESLLAGCPVLIGQETPWRGLQEKKAGWDLPLDEPEIFVDVLRKVVPMEAKEYEEWQQGARRCAVECIQASDTEVEYSHLFNRAL